MGTDSKTMEFILTCNGHPRLMTFVQPASGTVERSFSSCRLTTTTAVRSAWHLSTICSSEECLEMDTLGLIGVGLVYLPERVTTRRGFWNADILLLFLFCTLQWRNVKFTFLREYMYPPRVKSMLFIKLICYQWECLALTNPLSMLVPTLAICAHLHLLMPTCTLCTIPCLLSPLTPTTTLYTYLCPSQQGSFLWNDWNKG